MPSTTRARPDEPVGDPIESPEEPSAMRVVDLRAELHAAGVDHSGLKADLVKRVEAVRLLSPRTAAVAPARAARGTKRVRLNMEQTAFLACIRPTTNSFHVSCAWTITTIHFIYMCTHHTFEALCSAHHST